MPSHPTKPWEDARVQQGMKALFDKRRAQLAAGDQRVGWKIGATSQSSQQRNGVTGPIVGYLLRSGQVPPGGSVSVKGWTNPEVEPEIGVRMKRDLPAGATPEMALSAIKEIFPAIELADNDHVLSPDTLTQLLEGNICHRRFVFGEATRPGSDTTGLVSRMLRDGAEVGRADPVDGRTGKIGFLIAYTADVLSAFGEQLKADDVVICGTMVEPIAMPPSSSNFSHAIDPIGAVTFGYNRA